MRRPRITKGAFMNTSATGGFLQPEPGLARSDIERLIGDVIAGIT